MDILEDSYRFTEVLAHITELSMSIMFRTDKKKYYWLNRIVTHWNGLCGAIVNLGNALVLRDW